MDEQEPPQMRLMREQLKAAQTLIEELQQARAEERERHELNEQDYQRRLAEQAKRYAEHDARTAEQMVLHRRSVEATERQADALDKLVALLAALKPTL